MNRAQRRAASAKRRNSRAASAMRDDLIAFADEHGVYHGYIVEAKKVQALVMVTRSIDDVGDTTYAILHALRAWFARAEKSPPQLCINCETEFAPLVEPPVGFALMFPFSGTDRAIVTGVCRRCWSANDSMLEMAVRRWRTIMPDLRRIESGRA
jgi:hypothetical protein